MGWAGRLGARLGFGLSRDNALMFWAVLLNEGAVGTYIALWPLYLTALGATPVEIGFVGGAGGAVYLGAVIAGGWLADRVSTRWLLVGARSVAVLGLLLAGLAPDWWWVLPGRLLSSIGGLAWPVASRVITANVASERERLHTFTLIYTVGPSTALLLTPALGGQLAEQTTIRSAIWLAVALQAISTLGFAMVRPVAAPVGEHVPGTYGQALAIGAVRRLALLTLATGVTVQLANAFLPKFLQEVNAVSVGGIGLLDSVKAAGATTSGLLVGRLRRSAEPLIGVALALGMVGLGLGLVLLGHAYAWFVLAYLLLGGIWLIFSSYYAAMGSAAPEPVRARAFAFVEFGIGVGSSVGPLVAGFLYGLDPRAPILTALASALALLTAVAWLLRRSPR